MTPNEADDLGKRIINSFRGGPPLSDWREVLAPLDAGTAGTAYMRLRTSSDAPTVKQFMDIYRSLDTVRPMDRPKCGDCGGCGWVQAEDRIENAGTDNERRYSQCKPCRCIEGRQRAESTIWRERNGTQHKEHAA